MQDGIHLLCGGHSFPATLPKALLICNVLVQSYTPSIKLLNEGKTDHGVSWLEIIVTKNKLNEGKTDHEASWLEIIVTKNKLNEGNPGNGFSRLEIIVTKNKVNEGSD